MKGCNSSLGKADFEKDAWLSNLLGKPAYHLRGALQSFYEEIIPERPCFLQTRVPVEEDKILRHLQINGFHVIVTNLQFIRPVLKVEQPLENVRFAISDDCVSVTKLAKNEFRHNRFHSDPLIENATASRIKEEWSRNYFLGKRGNWMIVAEDNNEIKGFLLLIDHQEKNQLIIDLIAVASDCRGKGIAGEMINFAIQKCLTAECPIMVNTQISNLAAISFYYKHGFRLVSAEYTLHYHIGAN